MDSGKKQYDLEDRLINFAMQVCDLVEKLPNTRVANHLAGQITRSATSPAFNYGEAQEAQSKNDFIHKMSICRKELRETKVGLRMITLRNYENLDEMVSKALKENTELLSIFSASINTAKSKK
jgi:four helix bundle protein